MITYDNNLASLNSSTGRQRRGGVIVYTIRDGEMYFLFGVDAKTKQLCDFGGGIKNRETIVEGTLRELNEESCYIFKDIITSRTLQNSLIIHNDRMFFFFVHIDSNLIERVVVQYHKNRPLYKDRKYRESINVRWVKEEKFAKLVYGHKDKTLWPRIKKFLMTHTTKKKLFILLDSNAKTVTVY